MLKNNLTCLLLMIVILLTFVTGGAFAYMIKQSQVENNEFVSAVLECQVEEGFDGSQKTSIALKNSEISNISGYLRLKLVTYWVDVNGRIVGRPAPELSVNLGDGWIAGTDNTYYYQSPVAPNGLTSNLLASPLVLSKVTEDTDVYYQVVEVIAEAIQAEGTTDTGNVPAVVDAWGVTLTGDVITGVN